MTPFSDPYWQAALDAALWAADEATRVLVPAEFLPSHPRFAPLEYSWGLEKTTRFAWCCSKDDVDRLAPWLHGPASFYSWSNEVFVLGGNFRWARPASEASQRHLVAWHERVAAHRAGKPARELRVRTLIEEPGSKRRVLIIGASGMGNVGDDLLASVLAETVRAAGASADVSGPDIDPVHVAQYDALIVGGGGLVYASRDGANESQNLANYLKFGPMGRHLGVPTALIGVGDQDHARGVDISETAQEFARASLAQFRIVTTRDTASAALLERLGARKPRAACDLLFAWLARAKAAVQPSASQPRRLALAGEIYRHPALSSAFGDGGTLLSKVAEGEYDILVMSNDDVAHAQRLLASLRGSGATASIVDIRSLDFDALVFLFASYRGLLTTRFHGLVLAAMTGTPVLAFDIADGKLARLMAELGMSQSLVVDTAGTQGMATLAAALDGQLEAVPHDRVERIAARAEVHARSVRSLVGMPLRMRFKRAVTPRPEASSIRPTMPARGAGPVEELDRDGAVGLCWAASSQETEGIANLGDSLSAVMVSALSGRPVRHMLFDEPATKLVAVGSIGHAIRKGTAIVWGSGVSIRGGVLAQSVPMTRYDVRAIRGPISAQHYRDFGIPVPDVFGDPVWLLPSIVTEPVEKKYELGVIPHIQDVERHHPDAPARADSHRYIVDESDAKDVVVINTWHEPTWEGLLAKLRLIRSCRRIVSQSFHGVVIAEAYGIPVLNFRYLLGAKNGPLRVDLETSCATDPRVWEFYKGGKSPYFHMYSQRRDDRSDWEAIARSVDELWQPFEYDAAPMVEAFPLPLAYDPLRGQLKSFNNLEALRF